MDIKCNNENGCFSLRAAALIIDGGRILFAKSDQYDCYYTIGGGVSQNEATADAVLRECYEETGYRFEIDRLVYVQERFYSVEHVPHHEVTFFYLMKKNQHDIPDGRTTDQNNEHLYWIPIAEVAAANIVPAFLRQGVQNLPAEITHVVSYEQ